MCFCGILIIGIKFGINYPAQHLIWNQPFPDTIHSFFISLVWKTQANRWTKRMVNT